MFSGKQYVDIVSTSVVALLAELGVIPAANVKPINSAGDESKVEQESSILEDTL